jgi:hypothetical protein
MQRGGWGANAVVGGLEPPHTFPNKKFEPWMKRKGKKENEEEKEMKHIPSL